MTRRTYRVSLSAHVTVDDEEVSQNLLAFVADLPDTTLVDGGAQAAIQAEILASLPSLTPAQRLRWFLDAGYFGSRTVPGLGGAVAERLAQSDVEVLDLTVDQS